jgi:hypothetical protein
LGSLDLGETSAVASAQIELQPGIPVMIVVSGHSLGIPYHLGLEDRSRQADVTTLPSTELLINSNSSQPLQFPGDMLVWRVPTNGTVATLDLLVSVMPSIYASWDVRIYVDDSTHLSNCSCNHSAVVNGASGPGCTLPANSSFHVPQCIPMAPCVLADRSEEYDDESEAIVLGDLRSDEVLQGCSRGLHLIQSYRYSTSSPYRATNVAVPTGVVELLVTLQERPSSTTSGFAQSNHHINLAVLGGETVPTSITLGATTESAIDVPGDVDDYALMIPAGSSILIQYQTPLQSPSIQVDIDVLAADGQLLSGFGSADTSVTFTADTSQIVIVRVRSRGNATYYNNMRTGFYAFLVVERSVLGSSTRMAMPGTALLDLGGIGSRKTVTFRTPAVNCINGDTVLCNRTSAVDLAVTPTAYLYSRLGVFVSNTAVPLSSSTHAVQLECGWDVRVPQCRRHSALVLCYPELPWRVSVLVLAPTVWVHVLPRSLPPWLCVGQPVIQLEPPAQATPCAGKCRPRPGYRTVWLLLRDDLTECGDQRALGQQRD